MSESYCHPHSTKVTQSTAINGGWLLYTSREVFLCLHQQLWKKSFKWIYSWVREWGWKQFLGKSKILAKDPEEDYYYSIPLYELHWAELVRKVLTFLCQEHFAVISLWKIRFGSKLLAVSNQLHLLYPSHKWMGKGGSVHQSLLPLLRSLEICSAILEEEKTVLCNSSTKDKEEGKKKKSETKDIQLQSFWQELTGRKSVCVGFPGQRKQPVPCDYKIFTPTGKNLNDAEVIMSTQVDFFLKWLTAAVKAPSICCSRSRGKFLGMPPESLCRGRGIPPSPCRGPAAQGAMNIFRFQLPPLGRNNGPSMQTNHSIFFFLHIMVHCCVCCC